MINFLFLTQVCCLLVLTYLVSSLRSTYVYCRVVISTSENVCEQHFDIRDSLQVVNSVVTGITTVTPPPPTPPPPKKKNNKKQTTTTKNKKKTPKNKQKQKTKNQPNKKPTTRSHKKVSVFRPASHNPILSSTTALSPLTETKQTAKLTVRNY